MEIKRKMKKMLWPALAVGLTLLLTEPVMAGEIKIALDCPPNPAQCGTYLWSKTFSDYVTSKGLHTKLYPKDALGGEEEKLDQVTQGLLEISNSDLAKAGQLDPTIFGFDLPFLFKDLAHYYRTLEGSDLLAKINADISKKGVRVLALVPVGGMSGIATTKKFIKTPADFKGVRMRALDAKQAKWLEIWGANTVVIPWPEIYNALQTGVADGYLNPAIVPVMFKHTEVLKYFSVANLAPPLRIALASEQWYEGLSDKDRGIVDEGVKAANAKVKEWTLKIDAQGIEALKKAGVHVYFNTAADKAKFAEMIRPEYANIVGADAAKMFVKAADKFR